MYVFIFSRLLSTTFTVAPPFSWMKTNANAIFFSVDKNAIESAFKVSFCIIFSIISLFIQVYLFCRIDILVFLQSGFASIDFSPAKKNK